VLDIAVDVCPGLRKPHFLLLGVVKIIESLELGF
jgi:hypothetical protein